MVGSKVLSFVACAMLGIVIGGTASAVAQQVNEDAQANGVRKFVVAGIVAPGRRVAVPTRVAGAVESLAVDIGSRVREGDGLVALESLDAHAQVEESRASVEIARARVRGAQAVMEKSDLAIRLAEADLKRGQQSRDRVADSVTDAEVERREVLVAQAVIERTISETTLRSSEVEVALAMSKLNSAEMVLSRHQIMAPFEGVVTRVAIGVGEWGVAGATMIELSDHRERKVDCFLPAECAELPVDAIRAAIVDDKGKVISLAAVHTIAPEIDPAHDRVAARLSVAEPEKLPVGSRVSIELTWESR